MKKILVTLILLSTQYYTVSAQKLNEDKSYEVLCVGFYNLENLFDTIADPDTNKILQDEFTPHGKKNFTTERYQQKLANLSKVIADMGGKTSMPDGPAILGVCEIENRQVLEDLVAMPLIKDRNYKIVHYESPDRRGIDVGFLYQEKYFDYDTSFSYATKDPERDDWYTRDQLLVSGTIAGEKFHFMVAHWPSRRGGQKKSAPKRALAASLGKKIMDSLMLHEPDSKFVYMGDLNDDPVNPSLKKVMGTKGNISKIEEGDLYNPMESLFKKGIGTLAWRDNWNLFDQMICSSNLVETGSDFSSYKLYKAKVHNSNYLKNQEGSFKGYPKRSYVGTTWQGGYSDHFPVYLYLLKEMN
jgi:hypothetical protein